MTRTFCATGSSRLAKSVPVLHLTLHIMQISTSLLGSTSRMLDAGFHDDVISGTTMARYAAYNQFAAA